MTVIELIDILIPILSLILLVIAIVIGVYLVGIVIRLKNILHSVEKISDITGWLQLFRKWPKRKNKSS